MNLKAPQTPDEIKFRANTDKAFIVSHQSHSVQLPLKKPEPFRGTPPVLDVNTNPIEAFGFGTLRKEYPLELMSFQRRAPQPKDVVIEILYCGVCHSDWHVIRNEWKSTNYPIITGHEVIGRVVKVGNAVTQFKVGDFAALGPNVDSCQQCSQCQSGYEQYCENDATEAYNMPERLPGEIKGTGPITQGGYSNVIVAKEKYVLKVPMGSDLPKLAPILCAGITLYTPLKYSGLPKGARVGIAGLGGLGHIGVKLAKSMGYEVIVLTTSRDKLDDALRLGADQALLATDLEVMDAYTATFDLIICTIPFNHDANLYASLVKPQKIIWVVGALLPLVIDFDAVARKGRIIRGSSTAGIADTQECINYCVSNNIYPDIELIGVNSLNDTHSKIVNKQVRFRYVVDMSTLYL